MCSGVIDPDILSFVEYENSFKEKGWTVSKANKKLIGEWQKGNFFLFDNRAVRNERVDLLDTIENVIKQYGVDVILIDNLMTGLDMMQAAGSDKYEKQSQFVKALASIALKYNVLILLVAHKRKNNFSTNENDEVSGSGDIANLASLVIAYEKSDDVQPGNRLLKVSKNRLFGKVNTVGWEVMFDEKSKRITGINDDLFREYDWIAEEEFFDIDLEETPFS